jgi:hypothetical protein
MTDIGPFGGPTLSLLSIMHMSIKKTLKNCLISIKSRPFYKKTSKPVIFTLQTLD